MATYDVDDSVPRVRHRRHRLRLSGLNEKSKTQKANREAQKKATPTTEVTAETTRDKRTRSKKDKGTDAKVIRKRLTPLMTQGFLPYSKKTQSDTVTDNNAMGTKGSRTASSGQRESNASSRSQNSKRRKRVTFDLEPGKTVPERDRPHPSCRTTTSMLDIQCIADKPIIDFNCPYNQETDSSLVWKGYKMVCQTTRANAIQKFFTALHEHFPHCRLYVTEDGIEVTTLTKNRNTLIRLQLSKAGFENYACLTGHFALTVPSKEFGEKICAIKSKQKVTMTLALEDEGRVHVIIDDPLHGEVSVDNQSTIISSFEPMCPPKITFQQRAKIPVQKLKTAISSISKDSSVVLFEFYSDKFIFRSATNKNHVHKFLKNPIASMDSQEKEAVLYSQSAFSITYLKQFIRIMAAHKNDVYIQIVDGSFVVFTQAINQYWSVTYYLSPAKRSS